MAMFWVATISLIMFFGSLAMVWFIIVWLPEDYLATEHSILKRRLSGRPVLRMFLVVVKNLCGLLLLAAGVIMLVTPGQGLLFMLIGVSMLDVPGKRRAMRHLLSRGKVLKAINRIRARAQRPPLDPPQAESRA